MAICKACGDKYSRWTTPVSARGVCRACFEAELNGIPRVTASAVSSIPDETLSHMRQSFVLKSDTKPLERVPPAKPKARIRWWSFLPRSRSKSVFAITMACYAIVLSYLVDAVVYAIRAERPPAEFYSIFHYPVLAICLLLVFAPLIETLIVIAVAELVRRARAPIAVQIFAAAWVISFLHIKPWAFHAIIVFPAFCIQAGAYLYWRRESWKVGYWVVVSIHLLFNLIPAISAVTYVR